MPENGQPATSPGPSRHLAAILAVTIAPPALQAQKVEAEITAAGGSLVGQVDRTKFAEFHNARGAVLCAIRLQTIEGARGLHIGVHLGEMAGGEDALSSRGAQVSGLVAAIADPGGVVLSNVVHGQVKRMYHLRGTYIRAGGGHRSFAIPPSSASFLPWLLRKRRALAAGIAGAVIGACAAAGGVWYMKGRDVRILLPAPKLKSSSARTITVKPVPGMVGEALLFEWGEDPRMDTCEVAFAQPGRWRGAVGIRLAVKGTSSATVNVEAWENPRLTGQNPPGELWEVYLPLPSAWREVMLPFTGFVPNQYFKNDPANLNGILEPEEVVVLNFSLGKFVAAGGQFCLRGGSLVRRRRPAAPFVDGPPSGPVSVPVGEDGRWSAVPESAEKLMVRCAFDWGDGATSETMHVYSGETAGMAHRWTVPGRYKVRVKAVDIEGRSSALSGPVEVEVMPADAVLEGFEDLSRVYEWANPGCTVAKSAVPGVHGYAVRLACRLGKSPAEPAAGLSLDVDPAGGNWSSFSGIRLKAKREHDTPLYLRIHEKGKAGGTEGGEMWDVPLNPGREWSSLYAAFGEFKPALEEKFPSNAPNGRLDLDRIAGLAIYLECDGKSVPCSDVLCVDDLVLVVKGPPGKDGGR